ncbi:creatininase domain protein [Natronomonas pharaonis DSM 2160]|uniref:Creatininase domain protein n=1 Tax=Natronomonas pharaonis (strain ATCC 35678 / DSM 2160 / CIP 103997 / JCM 8858 / NBRC 14720 / NCIMB 2260 / Gabara) TaxID=348780 RepID=A0A1U7EVS7_NATPD|nr:creatininase family protein [Natronomonas pharaonis]CAI49151.1 creatininase domain protein [Natronomonas pharaonis DSM 2160]
MYLGDVSWPEAGTHLDATDVALVPVGSTEQHGPHLPLSTDHVIAEGLAREAADRAGVVCTPTITVGVSPHHRQFHGTMSVEAPVFRDYVESLSRSLVYQGIDRIVYVNAHGGNVEHLREVGRRLHEDGAAYAVEWMWDESIPDLVDDLFEQNGPHAGPKETSMVWYLADNVREDELADARDGGCPALEDIRTTYNGARLFYDAIENSDNGAFGDPTDATAAKGERLFEAASEQLADLAEWLAAQPWETLAPREHVRSRDESKR